MGTYLTEEGLLRGIPEHLLTQLTDDLEAGVPDAALLAEVIADAEAEVDAYVSQVRPLPLPTVPRFLGLLALDVALYRLFGRRQIADEAVADRYKAAVRSLEKIAKGEIQLGVPAPAAEQPGSVLTNKTAADRMFGRDVMDRY